MKSTFTTIGTATELYITISDPETCEMVKRIPNLNQVIGSADITIRGIDHTSGGVYIKAYYLDDNLAREIYNKIVGSNSFLNGKWDYSALDKNYILVRDNEDINISPMRMARTYE